MAETSLKSDIFLNQWIQIEIEWLRTPSNFCNLPVRPNQIHGNFQSRTDTRGIDYDICTQAIPFPCPLRGISDDRPTSTLPCYTETALARPQPTHPLRRPSPLPTLPAPPPPAASITTPPPRPSRSRAHSEASPTIASHPYCRAIPRRYWSDSSPTIAASAPHNFEIAAQRSPIVPGPRTTTRSPGWMREFITTELYATLHGSVKHAFSISR